ncbi:hypothetical protein AJ80_04119 [Polytolypa hystricis UAMH7299]|uniref:Uncharacterized protein n=1 Tax=Polytolypa hystricis (strain UAMH7299) TaxID=1447883 RepID=A0A2B7Y532_POLH7|nr:hypothetical protein AJ80_04119 [Polytolypa hystricis UAMH7299]
MGPRRVDPLPRYIASNLKVSKLHPPDKLAIDNLPPFFRVLHNEQVSSLAEWIGQGKLAREILGMYWPADFTADGKPRRNRQSWKRGDPTMTQVHQFLSYQYMGRPMARMATPINDAFTHPPQTTGAAPARKRQREDNSSYVHDLSTKSDDISSRESDEMAEAKLERDMLKIRLNHTYGGSAA